MGGVPPVGGPGGVRGAPVQPGRGVPTGAIKPGQPGGAPNMFPQYAAAAAAGAQQAPPRPAGPQQGSIVIGSSEPLTSHMLAQAAPQVRVGSAQIGLR